MSAAFRLIAFSCFSCTPRAVDCTHESGSQEFDAIYEQALTEADPDTLADLFVQMNDHIVMNNVVNPLVVVGSPRGASKRLRQENLAMAAFSYDYWNIANWNLADDAEG